MSIYRRLGSSQMLKLDGGEGYSGPNVPKYGHYYVKLEFSYFPRRSYDSHYSWSF